MGQTRNWVHVLRSGLALCGGVSGPPAHWPKGHCWLYEEQFLRLAIHRTGRPPPCKDCAAVLESEKNEGQNDTP